MKRRRWPSVLLALAVVMTLAAGCATAPTGSSLKGKEAPDFSLPPLSGEADNLRNYRGRTVILNFWASWCGPCRAEMPDLQVVHGELRDRGLVVVSVNQGEERDGVSAFAREFGLSFPILLDKDQAVGRKYGVNAYPTTFIIDGKGIVREVVVGGPLTRTMIRRLVEGLLK